MNDKKVLYLVSKLPRVRKDNIPIVGRGMGGREGIVISVIRVGQEASTDQK